MELRLKEKHLNYIENYKSIVEAQEYVNEVIGDLERLYDIDSLSNEELKIIIAKYYDWTPLASVPIDRDIENIVKSILKTDCINQGLVETSILTSISIFSKTLCYVDAIVYYGKDSGFDLNHIYTFKELIELINERKIVISETEWSNREVRKELASKVDLTEDDKLPTLDKIDENNFCGYDDVILAEIRRILDKGKVHRDIMCIISIMRSRLESQKISLNEERVDLDRKKALNQASIRNCNIYQSELNNIVRLCRQKLHEIK